jgi:hypothetical protein
MAAKELLRARGAWRLRWKQIARIVNGSFRVCEQEHGDARNKQKDK